MAQQDKGRIYHCNVCGSELMIASPSTGQFEPVCCNQPMVRTARRAQFYFCTVCGSELAVLSPGDGEFRPRCCDRDMVPEGQTASP
jgi:desulfoferrodoxin-like iron-binding protein